MMLWAPFGDRARELAGAVGAEQLSITFLYGPRYFAPVRYVVLSLRTLLMLLRRGPEVVIAQNPPIFCPLVCLLYCRVSGARLIVDHHAIWKVKTLGRGPLSRAIEFLEVVVARAAYANTAPHGMWAEMLVRMGARRVETVHDFVPSNPNGRSEALRRRLSDEPVISVASHGGHPLERLEVEAEAVGRLRGVSLLVSGPTEKLARRFAGMRLPPNVRYLGFLDKGTYESLKASADFAINITDEPYTLSHVIFEFAASGLPVISSKEAVVEEVFGDSVLYADSDAADVSEKARSFVSGPLRKEYRERIARKQLELARLHEAELEVLDGLVGPG